tara:strand:+ start:328 stop:546 length:219 start_codon:yes stop_codon:yes gene_type:complete
MRFLVEITLRQAGYTLEEINTMTDYSAFHRFLIAQKVLGADSGPQDYIPIPPPPPRKGVRRASSGSSYNFPA